MLHRVIAGARGWGAALLLVAAAGGALPGTAAANVGPIDIRAGTPEIRNSESVRMVSENVEMEVSPRRVWVHANFTMQNLGEAESLLVAFPMAESYVAMEFGRFDSFLVRVDGQPVDFQREWVTEDALAPGWPYSAWYTWTVFAPEASSFTIDVAYDAVNTNTGYTGNPYGDFTYIVGTGRYWAGSIESARFHMTFSGMDIAQVTDWWPPQGRVGSEGDLSWEFHDFEPDSMMSLGVSYEAEVPESHMAQRPWYTSKDEIRALLREAQVDSLLRLVEACHDTAHRYEDPKDQARSLGYEFSGLGYYVLGVGLELQVAGEYAEALDLYETWERRRGDIMNTMRPFSLLTFRMAECRFHLGDLERALAGYVGLTHVDWLSRRDYERWTREVQEYLREEGETEATWEPFEWEWKEPYTRCRGLIELVGLRIETIGRAMRDGS